MKTKFTLFILVLIFSVVKVNAQQADCNNVHLDNTAFTVSYQNDTVVEGNIIYLDTVWTVYPVLHLFFPDTSLITSDDIMVLSSLWLNGDTTEHFNFRIRFKTGNFANNTVVNAFFHIYDTDLPPDSIVNCYIPITITLQNPTSVNENANSNVKIYPNPVTDFLTVEPGKTERISEIELSSVDGKILYSRKKISEKQNISMRNYPKGIYLLKIKSDKGEVQKKIVKS